MLQHENKPFQDFPPICSPRKVVITAHDSSWAVTCPAACTRTGEQPLCPPHPEFCKDPSLLSDSARLSSGEQCPSSRAEKIGVLEAVLLLSRRVHKRSVDINHQEGLLPAPSCAVLGWNTPQQPQQQPPKKAPAASGRLSLFRETVAPQVLLWGGKILLH